jgi:CHAT domain-containing protein
MIPVHAAGIYEGRNNERVCCADYVVSSYTPSLTALLRARRTSHTDMTRKALSVLLVAEKAARGPNAHLPVIRGVEEETQGILAMTKQFELRECLLHNGSSLQDIWSAIRRANVVHIACHGIQESGENAAKSGFCCAKGRLEIQQLMHLKHPGGFLAFLSACETAMGDTKYREQGMHLASAMLASGFRHVIATMWYVLTIRTGDSEERCWLIALM